MVSRGNGKDSDILDLVKTRPGHWMNDMAQKTWERERSGPVRLSFECVIDGGESWQVSYDVQVKLRPGDL